MRSVHQGRSPGLGGRQPAERAAADLHRHARNKRADALCFIYRGGPTARESNEHDDGSGPTLLHDVFARVIVATRDRLQKLKHSDGGTPAEKEQLLCLLAGLEGALLLGLSFNQFGNTRDALLEARWLRDRR